MVIITGGAGFIGSAMLWELNLKGEENVVIVDDLGSTVSGKWRNLSGLLYSDFISTDSFPSLLERNALGNISAVIHMGANSSTTETDADHLLENNFGYSKKIASYCMQHGVRLIYASSAATYGDGSFGYCDDIAGIDRLRPMNMYGYSKQLFDRWAFKNNVLEHAAGLKFFNVYGPNEYHKGDMSSVIFKAFHQIMDKGRVTLFKSHRPDYLDGEQLRDFIHVRDCTQVMAWLLENPDVSGMFNTGFGQARSFNDLAKSTFSAIGRDPDIEYVPMPETLRDKYQYYTCADMKKLLAAGYNRPFIPLEEGVKDYICNYLGQTNPYLDLNNRPNI
jgi:ADP-L-glycero-D-manno-heptose 6-epimerase